MRTFIAGLALILVTAVAAVPAAAQNEPVQGRRPAAGQRVKPAARPRAALAGRPRLRKALRRLDANGDRQISRDEFKGPAARFGRLDRNGDGVISRDDRR